MMGDLASIIDLLTMLADTDFDFDPLGFQSFTDRLTCPDVFARQQCRLGKPRKAQIGKPDKKRRGMSQRRCGNRSFSCSLSMLPNSLAQNERSH